MAETIVKKKKTPWRKRLIALGLIAIVIIGGIYAYYATQKYADTKNVNAAYTVNAIEFIREFQNDTKAANAKYTNEIITVNGTISEIEAADTTMNIKFIDAS